MPLIYGLPGLVNIVKLYGFGMSFLKVR